MKRWMAARPVGALLVGALLVGISGCMYVSREAIPERVYTAETMKSAGMVKYTHVEEKRHGFRLIFIPISVPDPIEMVDRAINTHQAAGVTNLDVEFSELNFLLFQIPKVTVRADLVREASPE